MRMKNANRVLSIIVVIALSPVIPAAAADKKPAVTFALPRAAHQAPAEMRIGSPESMQTAAKWGRKDLAGNAAGLVPASSLMPDFWERDTLTAYKKAIDENKLLIVFFSADWCELCGRMAKELGPSKLLAGLQSCAVFLLAESGKDPAGLAIESALEIKSYPALSYIMPKKTEIFESGRITGYMPEEKILGWTRLAIESIAKEPDASPALAADPLTACRGLADFPVVSPPK